MYEVQNLLTGSIVASGNDLFEVGKSLMNSGFDEEFVDGQDYCLLHDGVVAGTEEDKKLVKIVRIEFW